MIGEAAVLLRWIRNRWKLRAIDAPAQSAILIVLFHGLFRSKVEATSGLCDPQQAITLEFFKEFVGGLLTEGLAIRELEQALRHPSPGLTICLTFDDGYYSNALALQVLDRFQAPATFFISTTHVEEQKAFWWDVVYRESLKRGVGLGAIARHRRTLKGLRAEEIEARLIEWFGPGSLKPVSDCDRPFTAAELADFARSPRVSLGNHTSDHAILINYDPQGIRAQIEAAQTFLRQISGTTPTSIAYPNGDYDAGVVDIARAAGLEFGVTTRNGLNVSGALVPMESSIA